MTSLPHIAPRPVRGRLASWAWTVAAACLVLGVAIRITAEEDALAALFSQVGQARLYDQIAFSRGPLVALYLQALHGIAGEVSAITAIRFGAVAAWTVSGVVVWRITLKTSGSDMIAFFCLAAVMANGYVLGGGGEASLAAALCVAPLCVGYACHCAAVGGPDRIRPAFVSGLAFGVAIAIAPSLTIVYAAVLLATMIFPRSEDPVVRLTRVALPSAFGMAVGALPLVVYWAADPVAVRASLVDPLLAHLAQPAIHIVWAVELIPVLLLAIVVLLLGSMMRPRLPMMPPDGLPILLVGAVVSLAAFAASSSAFPELGHAALLALAVVAAAWWPLVRTAAVRPLVPVIIGAAGVMVALTIFPLAVQAPWLPGDPPGLVQRIGSGSMTPKAANDAGIPAPGSAGPRG